jgi:hypothetical protein
MDNVEYVREVAKSVCKQDKVPGELRAHRIRCTHGA